MGSCYSSAAANAAAFSSKRSNNHPPPPPPPQVVCGVPSLVSIIEDPSGDDLSHCYTLGKELGRGEFGITYQCTHIESGEILACKSISKSKLRTQTDIDDVRREVQIMRHLPKHPNIVTLREAYEDHHAVHLVMELCEGGELFDRIVARGHYTERAAAVVTKTIIEVIKVCHEHGVMHRDLKPENFLFANRDETCQVKAIDFGLSIFFEPDQRFNEIVGSPFYMAPEVLRRNYGAQVDIWSAGVILYILLCGVPPYWGETDEGIAQAVVKGVIDFERDPWPKVSEDAKHLVRGMLDPNFDSRFTAHQVLEHPWLQNANRVSNVCLGETVKTRIKQFALVNKFKTRALKVVANNLSTHQLAAIKDMFQMMDTHKKGKLTFEQLKNGLSMIGHPVRDPDVHMLLNAADIHENGSLNSREFLTISTIHLKRIGSEEHLYKAFNYFDKNGSGFIEYEDLRQALVEEDNEQVIREIITHVDTDKDGQVSYEEFKAMMKAGGTDWRMGSRQYSRAMLNTLSKTLFKHSSLHLVK